MSGYVDANYVGDLSKSTTCYVSTCGGGSIGWRPMLHTIGLIKVSKVRKLYG